MKQNKTECQSCGSRMLGVLCHLDQPGLQECSDHKTSNIYKKGQVVFYEGNQVLGLYCVFEGKVKLYKTGIDGRQQIVRIAGPGDLLGYRSLFAEEPYQATAEAIEDAHICCIDKNAFFPLLGKNPDLSLAMIKKLSKELRFAENLATSIAQRPVRERMAELLLMLQKTYGVTDKSGTRIDIRLSREEIGDMIGVTQETAIRLLSDFRKDKLIEVRDRDITIIDEKKLLSEANIDY